ncbi:MAG: SurA N-terminal domain-containing protein [Verrucomicrobiales bacterium]
MVCPVSHAETQFVTGLAASVNQKPITWGEVRAAVRAQIQVIAMTERDPEKRQLAIAEAEGNALNDLIDRELILAAFEEKGGVIKKQYVDQDIARIIRENFDGSQPKFEEELKRTGMTYRQFRELREKMLIVQYMRGSQIEDPGPPTPDQLQSFVRDNRELFKEPDFAKVRTITVPKFTAELGSTKKPSSP